jgi:queuosine precursor transporter
MKTDLKPSPYDGTLPGSNTPPGKHQPNKQFRYYDLVMAAFVTILLCSNLIGAAKVCTVWGVTFGAGVLFFPVSYVFGDILTEVYGYARSRKVVWAGFVAMIFASFMAWFIIQLPAAQGWPNQAALETIFGGTPRLVAASLIAYCVGEFANSYTLAKMKIWSQGRWLWTRTVGSTIIGELIDSVIFYPIAFLGLWPTDLVIKVLVSNYLIKVIWEILMTPLTYKIVGFLKRAENEDYYDTDTNFTPFSLKTN